MKCEYYTLDNSIVSMLSFWFWSLYSGYVKNALILRTYKLMYLRLKTGCLQFISYSSGKKVCVPEGGEKEWMIK